jgi:hypothetical protein
VSPFIEGETELTLRGLGAETHLGEHHERGRLVLIVCLRSFGILNVVGGIFSGARTTKRSQLLGYSQSLSQHAHEDIILGGFRWSMVLLWAVLLPLRHFLCIVDNSCL